MKLNERFRCIVESGDTASEIITSIFMLTGKADADIARVCISMSPFEQQNLIEAALNEGGVSDEWQFVAFAKDWHRNHRSPSSESTAGGRRRQRTQDSGAAEETSGRLIGENANRLAETITTHIHAASLAGERVIYVIDGESMSGKTALCKDIARRVRERGLTTQIVNAQRSMTFAFAKTDVYVLDDADQYADMPQHEASMAQLLSSPSSILMSCRNLKMLSRVLATTNAMIVSSGSYTPEECAQILAHGDSRGYSLTQECAERLISALAVYGARGGLRDAFTARTYLLYPTLYHTRHASGSGAVSFGQHDILRAVARTVGRNVDELAYLSENDIRAGIASSVKGQSRAVDLLVPVVQNFVSGTYDANRPAAVMLFYGPSGVGKTEMAHAIADRFAGGVFHSESMSEYMEKHTAARFTGSPPGYLGYSETPEILKYLDRHSRGVLLLDEIEKAHPDIMTFLMQLFDTGVITEGSGKRHYARGWIIIMTSNLATNAVNDVHMGFNKPEVVTRTFREEIEATQFFRPEVLNRITEVVKFEHFDAATRRAVAQSLLDKALMPLKLRGIDVNTSAFIDEICAAYTDPTGARSMRSCIDTVIIPRILRGASGGQYV